MYRPIKRKKNKKTINFVDGCMHAHTHEKQKNKNENNARLKT